MTRTAIDTCCRCEHASKAGNSIVVYTSYPPKVMCELSGDYKDLGDVCGRYSPAIFQPIVKTVTIETDVPPVVKYKPVVKGKWQPIVRGEKGYSAGDFRCSVCGEPNHCYKLTNYCQNCGADMRGEEE